MRFLLLAAALSLVGCRQGDRDYVVFTASSYHDDATWLVPKEAAIQAKNGARLEIEKALAAATNEYGKKQLRSILDRWDLYVCQVIGVKKGGKDAIILRFFPRGMQDEYDFRDSQIQVKDGGASFWSIECDSEAAIYVSLRINGVA
jgi:hypothetical protein